MAAAARALAALAIVAARALAALPCDLLQDSNTTCVINGSHEEQGGDLTLEWNGSIVLAAQAALKAPYGSVSVSAAGTLTAQAGAWVSAQMHVNFTGLNVTVIGASSDAAIQAYEGQVTFQGRSEKATSAVAGVVALRGGARVMAGDGVALLGSGVVVAEGASVTAGNARHPEDGEHMVKIAGTGDTDDCPNGIVVRDVGTAVHGGSVHLSCNGSEVKVVDGASVEAFGLKGQLLVLGDSVALSGCNTSVNASKITVVANAAAGANISASLEGISHQERPPRPIFSVISQQGALSLGGCHGLWNVQEFFALGTAASLWNQTVRTQGSSCNNSQSTKVDRCPGMLSGLPIQPVTSDSNVSFDFAVAAQSKLEIIGASVYAASMIACSNGSAYFGGHVSLDASGRGCGPGEGPGAGTNVGAPWVKCGAGGASHIGTGGEGASYNPGDQSVQECGAYPGQAYDKLSESLMPTQGSSGGGCGVPAPCPDLVGPEDLVPPSSGGGLIWLSARNFSVSDEVWLLAPGTAGKVKPYGYEEKVSGAGAGGQILLYASNFVSLKGSVVLDVSGGTIQCTKSMVGGGGGGGFIGLQYGSGDAPLSPSVFNTLLPKYNGGGMLTDCEGFVPPHALNLTFGQQGQALSLTECTAGLYGMLCEECPAGKYSTGGSAKCTDCDNKPEEATYTGEGWPNATCPFKCGANVPSVQVNPMCQNASGYVFRFFGGVQGLVIILSSLAFFSVLLLTRHAGWRKRGRERMRSALRTWRRCSGPVVCCCRRARERFGSAGSGGGTDVDQSTFRFQKKHTPYHTCRVYLGGQNRRCCRWVLSASAPPAVEALVDAGRWESLAAEVNAATAVPSAEVFWERLLGVVYPPLAKVYAHRRRLRRAQRLRDCARGFSEDSRAEGQPEFWRPRQIQARVETAGRLVMAFDCDAGATLGYLDFFDFSRNPARDWAPVDLRQEVHLLVAHGDGSFLEPFELDIGDPVVQHLMQDARPAHKVIAAFNRLARLIPPLEELALTGGLQCKTLLRLQADVERCAQDTSLRGCVHVMLLSGAAAAWRRQDGRDRRISASSDYDQGGIERRISASSDYDVSLLRSPRPECSACGGGLPPPPRCTSGESALPATLPTPCSARDAAAAPHQRPPPTPAEALPEVKFCLAFLDLSACPSPSASPAATSSLCLTNFSRQFTPNSAAFGSGASRSGSGVGEPEVPLLLTSPMARGGFWEALEELASVPLDPDQAAASSNDGGLRPSLPARLRARFRSLQERGSHRPSFVLEAVLVLMFMDTMVFVLMAATLHQVGPRAVALWMVAPPPCAGCAALILGPVAVLLESPRLARSYAQLSLFGVLNAVVSTLVLLPTYRLESWLFDLGTLVFACGVKSGLAVFASLHACNLEIARDVAVVQCGQAEMEINWLLGASRDQSMNAGDDGGACGSTTNLGSPQSVRTSARGSMLGPFPPPARSSQSPF